MLTEKDIDQFYKDFEEMQLIKPVALMAGLTGLSSGNVSEYLSRKKKPSERFIKVFYEKVYKGSTNVPRETTETKEAGADPLKIIASLTESNRMLAEANLILATKINSGAPASASFSSGAKEKVSRNPVEELQPGRQETNSSKNPRRKKDSVID